jgi:hypothetical protein
VAELSSTRQLGSLNPHYENKELHILHPELHPELPNECSVGRGGLAGRNRKGETNEEKVLGWAGVWGNDAWTNKCK